MTDQPNLDPWTYFGQRRAENFLNFAHAHGATDPVVMPGYNNVEIFPDKFVEFILTHRDSCQQKWFHPRDILSQETNVEMALPLEVGLHQGNTFEFNWGLYNNTSEKIKDLIGIQNLQKIGYDPDTLICRLIVYMPGHGIPWHRDTMDAWRKKFTHLDPGSVQRKLLMVTDWHWGQMLQLDNQVYTHWASGDVYNIPIGQWHCSANQGVKPKITVSLTGSIKETQK